MVEKEQAETESNKDGTSVAGGEEASGLEIRLGDKLKKCHLGF